MEKQTLEIRTRIEIVNTNTSWALQNFEKMFS